MNLCLINPSNSPRPEIYGLAEHLPHNYNITILQPSDTMTSTEGFHLKENVYIKNIPTFFLTLSGSKVSLPVLHSWLRVLSSSIKENRCDLIHVCDYEYPTSILTLLIRQIYKVPILIVNDALLGRRGYVFGSRAMDFLGTCFTSTFGKKILEGYDKIVFIYSKLANEAQMLGIPHEKIAVIPNGIDFEKMEQYSTDTDRSRIRHQFGLKDNEKLILYVGRLVGVKRVHIIIDVVKQLVNLGHGDVRALIVGEGSQKRKLENLASPLKDRVIFAGFVSEREKYQCYAAADVFILPSLSEGLPTVLLESAAMGMPAIATNVNGIPDIVLPGKTGFLVDPFDTLSFTKHAMELIEHRDLADRMGENARKHVKSNFSWRVVAEKYQRIYESSAISTRIRARKAAHI